MLPLNDTLARQSSNKFGFALAYSYLCDMSKVTASIVTYNAPVDEVKGCIEMLGASCVSKLWIVDNSPEDCLQEVIAGVPAGKIEIKYIQNGKNIGFGAAHNIAIREAIAEMSDFHLVMNHDVRFSPDVISQLAEYLKENPDVAQVIPNMIYPDGKRQDVVRMLPTPLDVFGRRFLPSSLFQKRNARYTLSARDSVTPLNVPYHQGSFILFRTRCLEETGGFDERFFLYPEDIDITRRMHERWRTMYYPKVTIIHDHRQGSYHSKKLLWIHCTNMIRYFNKWGWWHDPQRRAWNREVQKEINHDDALSNKS